MTTENDNEDELLEEVAESTEPTELTTRNVTPGKKRQRLRLWVRRLAIALAILGPLVFVIAALGYRIRLFSLKTSLLTLSQKVGPFVMVAGIVVALASIVLSIMVKPKKGLIISLVAMLVPTIGLLKTWSIGNSVASLPFIHDITTDTEDPPQFTQTIIDLRNQTENVNTLDYFEKKDPKSDTLVSVQQSKHYPNIRTLPRSEAPEAVFGEAEAIIKSIGWEIVTIDPENWIIEATDTTFWYGFKDDVVIRIRPSKNGGSLIDMRSVSRIGGSDLGANAERLTMLMEGLEEK